MGSTRFFFDCKKEMGGMTMDSYTKYRTMGKPARRMRAYKKSPYGEHPPLCALRSVLCAPLL